MANAFLNADHIAALAVELVKKDLVLGNLVHRDYAAEFGGGRGETIRVRVPGALPARTRAGSDKTTALVDDEVTEQSIPVTLDTLAYSSVLLSESDMSLNLEDFGRQVLKPQTDALVAYCERTIAAAMKATPDTVGLTLDAAAPAKLFTKIRTTLRNQGVPASMTIRAVVGTDVAAALLDGPAGTWDTAGNATAEAGKAMGKVRGIEIYESNRLAGDEVIGFVPNAFTLAVRAPVMPQGASTGRSFAAEGFALRWIADYQSSIASDRSLLATFVGAKAMPLPIVDETTGDVTLTPNAGAVRVLTAS
ncbi:P22 phage major capsid protein family protein [Micromonospora sp. WMMD718]|uniref:P22 phage major capsid protein family protein n=1 Tax=Micromonospora sp. WMMD718 TaxID=3016098 RepID=UPI002416762E|nr:P22 phage major capsid protein family protein [Micromonospora sp. WMMD718]MDG4751704.1 P22 phage major capsid protein family protein [Micromonospora sp. WMMD718]